MYLVFTDLDSTLLDHFTYSYEESLPGLSLLKKRGYPLVLVSSKTKPEMALLHRELGLESPFIFENGAGIAWYDNKKGEGDDFTVEFTGCGLSELLDNLDILKSTIKSPVKTILEMEAGEIAAKTGLTERIAKFSKMRLASLPFILPDEKKIDMKGINDINAVLNRHGFAVTRGGRFFHFLSKEAGKGPAVKKIMGFYKTKKGLDNIRSMALGDSENDISMLEAVDAPYLVRRHDGSFIETGLVKIHITENIGPAGFSEAVYKEIG